MKTIIALFLLSLFVKDPYYMTDAKAVPVADGTAFICEDGNVFTSYDRYQSGSVVLVMDSCGTEDVTDDVIWQVVVK